MRAVGTPGGDGNAGAPASREKNKAATTVMTARDVKASPSLGSADATGRCPFSMALERRGEGTNLMSAPEG